MNMWGFIKSFLKELEEYFPVFLGRGLKENPMKCEYFLPSVVSALMQDNKASVSVLSSKDRWYGVTYREDKALVVGAIKTLKENGVYPEDLWEER